MGASSLVKSGIFESSTRMDKRTPNGTLFFWTVIFLWLAIGREWVCHIAWFVLYLSSDECHFVHQKCWMIMQCRRVARRGCSRRRVEERAKIVWINLLESAEVALVTHQSNVPDLWWVNGWRKGLLETLLRLSCEWDVFREKRLQIESLRKWVRFTVFESRVILLSRRLWIFCSDVMYQVWVGHNVIMTEVWHSHPQL
jgi:hypothetical protein